MQTPSLKFTLPPTDEAQMPIEGEPDLAATRLLCFGTAALCAFFAGWLPMAAVHESDRLSPEAVLPVGFLVLVAMVLAGGMAFFLARAGRTAGAWFRVDGDGFAYGPGLRHAGPGPERAGTHMAWSQIERQPQDSCDVRIASMHRSEVLNPHLAFWCRSSTGELVRRTVSLQWRDDVLACVRFRNAHALKVAVLQGMAAQGLRFSGDVFVEAAVDPETWQPMKWPRRTQWLVVYGTLGFILLTVRTAWSAGVMALYTLAIMGLGYGVMAALTRSDARLTGVVSFVRAGVRP